VINGPTSAGNALDYREGGTEKSKKTTSSPPPNGL
jgi:hypothetical protein